MGYGVLRARSQSASYVRFVHYLVLALFSFAAGAGPAVSVARAEPPEDKYSLSLGDTTNPLLEETHGSCGDFVAMERDFTVPALDADADAQKILAEVSAVCDTALGCTPSEAKSALRKAIGKLAGPSRHIFNFLLRLPGRAIVIAIWAGGTLGAGYLTHLASVQMELPDSVKGSFTAMSMLLAGIFLGRMTSPIEKRLGPRVEQLANLLWGTKDAWGQLQVTRNESERILYGQLVNQIYLLRSNFKGAAVELSKANLKGAAHFYVGAVLDSMEIYAGIHLDHPVTVRAARLFLKNYVADSIEDISLNDRIQIVELAVEESTKLHRDELTEKVDAREVPKVVKKALCSWLHLEPSGRSFKEANGIH